MDDKTLSITNLFTFIIVLAVNSLANIIPINGYTTGEVSSSFQNIFTPAAFTFSIWGLIYVLLGIFAIYQVVKTFKKEIYEPLDDIGYWFIVVNILNSLWIITWHYLLIPINLIIMLLLLLSLIIIYNRLKIGRSNLNFRQKIITFVPFSIYLGWISVATIANISVFLVSINWNRFGLSESFLTVLVLAVAILLGLIFIFKNRDVFYALVVVWALFGILSKRMSVEPKYPLVVTTVIIGLVLLSISIIYKFIKKDTYLDSLY